MSKIRWTMLCLLGALALSAVAAPAASAAEWWVNGSVLTTPEEIAEETTVSPNFVVKFGSIEIECSKVKIIKGHIEAPNRRSEESVWFEMCKVVGQPACTIGTIKTNALSAELEGTTGSLKLKFKPTTGTVIASFEITGASCPVSGKYEAVGIMLCGYKGVETEATEHSLEFTRESGSKVEVRKMGGPLEAATFTGTDTVKLHSGLKWSAR